MTKGLGRLVWRCALFAALNAVLAVTVLKIHETTLVRKRWETDSILLVMPEDEHRDVVMLGTSHAYVCARFQEHQAATERALGRSVFNMAVSQGGGITPARFYLETYFDLGNRADHVVYLLDPFVFYTAGSNEDHKFVNFEPFRFRFLAKMVYNGYNYRQIVSYLRSKFSAQWLLQKPEVLIHHVKGYPPELVTPARIEKRMKTLYPDGLPEANFERYKAEFLKIVACCKAQGAALNVVIPPTLMGSETGHGTMMAWLETLRDRGDITLDDFSNAMKDPARYYNLDHLNLSGIEQLMGQFVRPVLDGEDQNVHGGPTPVGGEAR
jgi:hypothetical protein